jgi:hypothetical protein
MCLYRYLLLIGFLGIWILVPESFVAQEKEKDDIETLARGPIHEAYAEPHEINPTPSPIVDKQPPEAIEELPPDQKPEGENVQWITGYWSWDEERKDFIWVSGFWRIPPPNRVWMSGSWRQVDGGWQWVSGFWGEASQDLQGDATGSVQTQIEYLPEPPASLETGPTTPAPSEEAIYTPGTWIYREKYVWQPGHWINNRPGWVWIPPTYHWCPGGFVFVPGYWDYPCIHRGILFAPVYIPPRILGRSFVYTPTFVIREQAMFGALFVRRGFNSYYFGDYFTPRYVDRGFTPWVGGGGFQIGVNVRRGFHDPLFNYYRVNHRNDPYWNRGIGDLYTGRYKGTIDLPPRTLVQQNTVINNITNNKTTVNNTTINNVTMLSSLQNIQKDKTINLQPVSASAIKEQARAAKELQAIGAQRTQLESQLIGKNPKAKKLDAPRSIKLDVPKPVVARSQVSQDKLPPVPKSFDPKLKIEPPKTPKTDPKGIPIPKVEPPKGKPKTDPPKVDPPKVDPPKGKPKTDPPKVDPPKVDPPKGKPKTDPPKVDPPKGKPKTDPPKVDPPKTDPPKVDPPKTLPPKEDPPKGKPKTDPPKVDPPKVIPKTDPPKVDPPKGKPKTDPPKVDPPKTPPPKVDPPKTPPPKVDPPKGKPKTEPPKKKEDGKTPPPKKKDDDKIDPPDGQLISEEIPIRPRIVDELQPSSK